MHHAAGTSCARFWHSSSLAKAEVHSVHSKPGSTWSGTRCSGPITLLPFTKRAGRCESALVSHFEWKLKFMFVSRIVIKYFLIESRLNRIQIQTDFWRAAIGGDVNRARKTLHNTVLYGVFSPW